MKKLILTLAVTAGMLSATAQRLLIIDSLTIDVNDVDYISYEADSDSPYKLLPEAIAADPKTTIFSEALQLTRLADSIKPYKDRSYESFELRDQETMIRATSGGNPYSRARYISHRWQRFTAFVETDSVFQVAGINNLQDLQAYAKRVYDEVYPEDASVSDPTDRRHSLNRFVAYHLLPFSSGYRWLVSANERNQTVVECMPGTVRDASAYYETLMPQASLKCSYPVGAISTGIYLNRSGLRSDCTVRGAYIMEFEDYQKEHHTENGIYYYIDQPLVYDRTTQQEVLNELWRVDFKTLSPDLMNTAMNYDWGNTDDFIAIPGGYARNFETDGIMVALHTFNPWWNMYEGDGVVCSGMHNVTVKLPPLPAGTWQVRLGYNCGAERPVINTYIDEVLQFSSIDLRQYLMPEDVAADDNLFPGPDDYFPGGSSESLADRISAVRRVIGTLTSTGTGNHYLRMESIIYNPDIYFPLDYLEFVPVK